MDHSMNVLNGAGLTCTYPVLVLIEAGLSIDKSIVK